jgi:predicted heme/steroid binding protein
MMFVFLSMFLMVLISPGDTLARSEFARLTGKACGYCHVSPLGGGSLNQEGIVFRKNLHEMDIPTDPALRLSTGQKLLHILLWLIHIPFGVGWLVLFIFAFLPSLKKGGLGFSPRLYISRIIIFAAATGVAGTFMVYIKSLGMPDLFSTRFGMLLLVKITAVLTFTIATAVLLWNTTILLSKRYRELASSLGSDKVLDLSPEDLRLFDGSDKRSAIVAVDGKLYNVTGMNLWRNGIHPGGHRAGIDLTMALARAPHGKDVFERMVPAGNLLDKPQRVLPGSRWAVFLGLASAAVILLVVVLWRW